MSPRDRNPRKTARRLVNMTGEVPIITYRCPDAARPESFPIDLDAGSWLYVETWYLAGRVVWFVLAQWFKPDDDGPAVPIARIDCCGNTVHEHRFTIGGVDVLDHRVICDLAQGNPQDRVHQAFSGAYDLAIENWERNLELWRAS